MTTKSKAKAPVSNEETIYAHHQNLLSFAYDERKAKQEELKKIKLEILELNTQIRCAQAAMGAIECLEAANRADAAKKKAARSRAAKKKQREEFDPTTDF